MTPLEIELVPCLRDNYAYLVRDADEDFCAIVDPSEAAPVRDALKRRGWRLTHILNTHHHPDHTGGNAELKRDYGAQVIGPEKDRARIPALDQGVEEGSPFALGSHAARVLDIPAHTRAHIAFAFEADDVVFTGDTLFAMGCGRLFEGTPGMMWRSLSKLMTLPDSMRVYCGHEYTLNNGRFALMLEPGNADLLSRVREVEERRAADRPTIPSSIGLEKRTNPFLRPQSAEIRRTLNMAGARDVEVFAEMRARKDHF
ncbi:MAG TPA: hydroxyacylglutathione hydrolase [Rhizomicrobium sp.]|jgi:hydroxyacylglutathione hydrolase|nr:hydroxyacylglutathione hydrolase [Rhizomicrobium sp.]